jgi:glyoxylate/hydroxypyruvate reductase
MSILLICNNKDPKPWAEALDEKLPAERIEIFPEVENDKSVEFIICWRPEKNIFKRFPNLKAIQSLGASVNHIFDTNRVRDNIQVSRIIDSQLSQDIFEFTLAATLNHIRRLNTYARLQEMKAWIPMPYRSIKKTTVSILGLGKIGGYVAKKFAAMGFKVQGWSTSVKKIPGVKSFTGKEGLYKLLENTEVLINILPLTKETKGILNRRTMSRLKSDAYIINAGRGEHIVEKSLLEQIKRTHISGALLDVFYEEPLPIEHPFWNHSEIRITPHIAALTNIKTSIGQIVENYNCLKKGKKLLNTVSVTKGY